MRLVPAASSVANIFARNMTISSNFHCTGHQFKLKSSLAEFNRVREWLVVVFWFPRAHTPLLAAACVVAVLCRYFALIQSQPVVIDEPFILFGHLMTEVVYLQFIGFRMNFHHPGDIEPVRFDASWHDNVVHDRFVEISLVIRYPLLRRTHQRLS